MIKKVISQQTDIFGFHLVCNYYATLLREGWEIVLL